MTRFVIDAPVAIHLATSQSPIVPEHALLAPTLLRSEALTLVYASVKSGECDVRDGRKVLDDIRALKIRLLGDRVLQSVAWDVARKLDWPDTYKAEYIALTTLQADVFVTLDEGLASAAATLVQVGSMNDLLRDINSPRVRLN